MHDSKTSLSWPFFIALRDHWDCIQLRNKEACTKIYLDCHIIPTSYNTWLFVRVHKGNLIDVENMCVNLESCIRTLTTTMYHKSKLQQNESHL